MAKRYEQSHQDDHRNRPAGIVHIAGYRGSREDENDGQPDQKNVERDLVGCLLPLGALDQPDHAVEEGGAGRGGDPHLDPVGQHLSAAGDGRAVAPRFPNDGRGLAGDRGFVNRGDALHYLSV